MFNQMKQMYEMKKKFEEVQKQLAQVKVEKSNFSKTLSVKANGTQKLESLSIDANYLSADKKADLENALVKLINEALEDAQKSSAQQAASLMQNLKGLNIPGM
jgi:DNA-binding protein YbaB